jgi:addiction module RelE/StbE family toxin
MRVRWTTDAADDLEKISNYISQTRPETARRVAEAILEQIGGLDTFPNRGRHGRVEGTRELILRSLPFVAVYEVHEESVQILRILHGAQRWPPA